MVDPTIIEAHESYVLGVKFTWESNLLLSCGMDNVVKVWRVGDWQHLRTIE